MNGGPPPIWCQPGWFFGATSVQLWPSQLSKVSATQKLGWVARTRKTSSLPSTPRTAVSSGPAKPRNPPTPTRPEPAWTGKVAPLAVPSSPAGEVIETSPPMAEGNTRRLDTDGAGRAMMHASATTTNVRAPTTRVRRRGRPTPLIDPHIAAMPTSAHTAHAMT